MTTPLDHNERWQAASESKANVVVTAGAGTGKTYLLVNRLLHLLIGQQVPPQKLVALTFTRKAAGEMRARLTEALKDFSRGQGNSRHDLRTHYHLKEDEVSTRAIQALSDLDKAQIDTIHSFAAHLLRLYPLQAGVDPAFEIDENERLFEELWQTHWTHWLETELQLNSSHEQEWRHILWKVELDEVRALAYILSDFQYDLENLSASLPLSALKQWAQQASELLNRHPGDFVVNQKVALARELFTALALTPASILSAPPSPAKGGRGQGGPQGQPRVRANDFTISGKAPKDWGEADFQEAKRLAKLAQSYGEIDPVLVDTLRQVLVPFIERFRKAYLMEGFLTHNALLIKARDLVRDHPDVRERLKQQFRAFLVDEFQDTDPLQGEILLFLCEQPGKSAERWTDVHLEPGKVFIVGDPKQSIYRFRGADFRAFEQISRRIVDQGGVSLTLSTNFRSHNGILRWVNHVFSRALVYQEGLQPAYDALTASREPAAQYPMQGIGLTLVRSSDPTQELSSEGARQEEARQIARWIKTAVETEKLPAKTGSRSMEYADVAIILRALSSVSIYLDALREEGIPFVVEGEKYFFNTSEVVQAMNLLRVLADPYDKLSLAGVLRSPFGGLTDKELYELTQLDGLNFQTEPPTKFARKDHLKQLYETLRQLYHSSVSEPVEETLGQLFNNTFLLELAARSYHREQTLANLGKLRRLAEGAARKGLSFRETVRLLTQYMEEAREEGESPVADATTNAVRILSIHKAKGLEFPVVILPNLHRLERPMPSHKSAKVMKDWSRGLLGFRLNRSGIQSPAMPLLSTEYEVQEKEEEKRVLYVGMTRARERLILTGSHDFNDKSSALGKMETWLETSLREEGVRPLGDAELTVEIKTAGSLSSGAISHSKPPKIDLDQVKLAQLWLQRQAEYERAVLTPKVISPSILGKVESPVASDKWQVTSGKQEIPNSETCHLSPVTCHPNLATCHLPLATNASPRLLGSLLHRFLELWDFKEEKCHMPKKLREVANSYFASLGMLKEPFPDPKGSDPLLLRSVGLIPLVPIVEEAQSILAEFIGSEPYNEIAQSEILGREVPFFYQNEAGQLVRGVIDALYKTKAGKLIIGDYKSDKMLGNYEEQGKAYQEAFTKSLDLGAIFKVIPLRNS